MAARVVGRPSIEEPQDAWELVIAGYLYLGGLGAGAFIVAIVSGWFGLALAPTLVHPVGGWDWDWSQACVLWGPFATAIGAGLLVFHLGRHRLRFYSACFNPRTSWLARGFLILSGFIVLGALVALVSIFLPSLPGRIMPLWRSLEALGVLFALGTAVYTAILLQSMSFIPAWNSPFLPYLFLASALSTGAVGVIAGALIHGFIVAKPDSSPELARVLEYVEPALVIIEASILALYVRHLRRGKYEGLLSSRMWLSGRWRVGFWGGIVGLALVLPFLLDAANLGVRSEVLTLVAAVSVLTGGFLLRCGILAIGVKESPPLYKYAQWRASHAAVEPVQASVRGTGK